MSGWMRSAARATQRRLRVMLPDTVARVTWAYRRRAGDRMLALVEALVRPGDTVVDIGANWGLYAGRLARLVGPRGRVDAFEPHPTHTATLRALARRHPQLRVHHMGVAEAPGIVELHVPMMRGRAVTALASLEDPDGARPHQTIPVHVETLDAALADVCPTFVKCDVEGSELRVLQGAAGTLRRSQPVLLIEIEQRHSPIPIEETFAYLIELGYDGYFEIAGALHPLAEFDVHHHQLAYVGEQPVEYEMPAGYVGNFLFVARGSTAPELVG